MATPTGEEAIRAYKQILSRVVDKRPSGTRQRLADALGKHRSFVTQITSATYATPLPAPHLPIVFSVCHFSPAEQQEFLAAYRTAHPGRLAKPVTGKRLRHLSIMVPDMGDEEKNRIFDQAIVEFAHRISLITGGTED